MVASTVVGLSEALVFGERSGLDRTAMLDVFGDSAVGATALWVASRVATASGRPIAIGFNLFGLADLVVAVGLGAVCPGFEFGYAIKDLEGPGTARGTVWADRH